MGSSGNVGTPNNSYPQPTVVMDLDEAQNANAGKFSDSDDSDYHQLFNGRQYYLDQEFNIDTMMAIQDYLNNQAMYGDIYSISQALNYKLETGQPLNDAEQAIVDGMRDGMHNLGYNVVLERYGRVDYLDRLGQGLGINKFNYENMTEAQLKAALVGRQYTENKLVSTSYNNFKNAPNGGAPFTDKAVKFTINAKASTQAMMPGNGPGGQLGEIVLKDGQSFRIVDVKFTGKTGRSGASRYKQIEFIVETV